uniref:EGF-like domain-containing protein n=1 Tax=Electrophorus electricus TaxID=8005 RepID=A0A4W4GEG4_ELEEL
MCVSQKGVYRCHDFQELQDRHLLQKSELHSGTAGLNRATYSYFLGCIRDVHIQAQLMVPGSGSAWPVKQVNVSVGCNKTDECEGSPCWNRGRCISLGWKNHTCECHRPYEGYDCLEEYISARFGTKDSESYAVFSVEYDPGDTFTVSMFVHSRHLHGLLLTLSNSTSLYFHLWLEWGKVKVQVDISDSLQGHNSISDGHTHLVSMDVEKAMLSLSDNQNTCSTMALQSWGSHYLCLVNIIGVTNVTLHEGDPVIAYRGNGTFCRPLRTILLEFQMRRHSSSLLHADHASEFVTVSFQDRCLVLELQGIVGILWLWLDKASVSFTAFGDLDFLRKGVDILLESRGPKAGMSLEECLGSVEVGDLLLASYAEVNLHLPRLQKMFVRLSGAPYLSCQGAGVCDFNPCQLGCASSLNGSSCKTMVDPCAPNPCIHGTCSAAFTAYEYLCESGYTGRNCEHKVNVYVRHKCHNWGICLLSVCRIERWNYSCFNGGNCSSVEDSSDCLSGFTGQC